MPLLDVRNLRVDFRTVAGIVHAVDGVSLSLEKGEIMGIAGESGCGKTTMALAVPGLLARNATVPGGQIIFDGEDLISKSEDEMRTIRWRRVSVIFQGSMNAMNPLKTVGSQIVEPILLHEPRTPRREAEARAEKLLDSVGISKKRFSNYPHEFSGGMRQRAMIAMSLACGPDLVLADEPVTALDVMIQAQILELIKVLCSELGLSLIMISHDLSVLAELCDTLVVMYAGRVVEHGRSADVFREPAHPYSARLMNAFPDIYGERVFTSGIPGYPPNLIAPPVGCGFYERCPERLAGCESTRQELSETSPGHWCSCLYPRRDKEGGGIING
ncbi:MAG: ABC transporter ATP-binding protein [Synergistaceae bacterium]|jgi:peptide/nickel transport system ATP-binding protein|nr:ABC transporter ATP-binding protein [Synergistaceae bacterium]